MLRRLKKILAKNKIPAEIKSRLDLKKLEKSLGVKINDPNLFIQALTHRSFVQIAKQKFSLDLKSNERLEFLGDSILNLVAGELLFKAYPDAPEGKLTRLRSRLISRSTLARYARMVNLQDFLLMSRSASRALKQGYDSMLADAFEAVVAAIYLDSGYNSVKKFLAKIFKESFGEFDRKFYETTTEPYKSMLIEYAHKHNISVTYNLVKVEGPEHDKTFTVEVMLGDETVGVGAGKTKREAEKSAAYNALVKLGLINHTQ